MSVITFRLNFLHVHSLLLKRKECFVVLECAFNIDPQWDEQMDYPSLPFPLPRSSFSSSSSSSLPPLPTLLPAPPPLPLHRHCSTKLHLQVFVLSQGFPNCLSCLRTCEPPASVPWVAEDIPPCLARVLISIKIESDEMEHCMCVFPACFEKHSNSGRGLTEQPCSPGFDSLHQTNKTKSLYLYTKKNW